MIGLWWTVVPTILEMVVAAMLPTVFWVRARVRSTVVALAVAPALTLAAIAVLSLVFDIAGIEWERARVLPVLGLLAAAGALAALFSSARAAAGGRLPAGGIVAAIGPRRPLDETRSRVRVSTWAMIAIGLLLAALPMLLRADPRLPAQQWDSTFHLNGVWTILRDHSASPFGGLAALYGGRRVFYPTGWHAFVALFATPTTVVRAANASSILLMLVWVLGATALTSVLTSRRGPILAAPVLAGLLLDMPADSLTMYNQWPNATGLALVPGAAALAVLVGRRLLSGVLVGPRALIARLPEVLALLVALVGAAAAHPSAVFVLAALLVPGLLAGAWHFAGSAAADRRPLATLAVGVLALLGAVAPFAALAAPKIRAMGDYPRSGISWSFALARMFTPSPPFEETRAFDALLIVQTALLVAGIAALLARAVPVVRELFPPDPIAEAGLEPDGVGGASAPPETSEPGNPAGTPDPEGSPLGSRAPSPLDAPADADGVAAPPLDGLRTTEGALPGSLEEHRDRVVERASQELSDPQPAAPPLWVDAPTSSIGRRVGADEPDPLWPILSYLVFCVLTLLAYAPLGEIRNFLLAPWYMDARRIMGAHGLAMVPLMAIGFDAAASAIHRRLPSLVEGAHSATARLVPRGRVDAALGLVLVLATGIGALDSRLAATDYVYAPENLGKPGMASTAELAMIRRTRLRIPGDSVVLGDPIAGAAYVEVLGQHTAFFPQLSMVNGDEESQEILAKRFNEILTNPEVCEVVRKYGITHYYQDEDGWYYDFRRSSRSPGLYDVDTSIGFELVDQGGTAKLYRITACGEI